MLSTSIRDHEYLNVTFSCDFTEENKTLELLHRILYLGSNEDHSTTLKHGVHTLLQQLIVLNIYNEQLPILFATTIDAQHPYAILLVFFTWITKNPASGVSNNYILQTTLQIS